MSHTIVLGVFLFAFSLPGLCTGSSTAKPAAPHARPRSAPAPLLPDAQIEKDIRARLAASARISEDHFTVHVQGGVATLEGQTGVLQHKGAATRMAKRAGAVRVVNRIQISQQARDKATANLTQGRRRAQIKRSEYSPRSEAGTTRKTR